MFRATLKEVGNIKLDLVERKPFYQIIHSNTRVEFESESHDEALKRFNELANFYPKEYPIGDE